MKFGATNRGFTLIEFEDRNGIACSLQDSSIATEPCIWLGSLDADPQIMGANGWEEYRIPAGVLLHTRMHLGVEAVRSLLPMLQHFVAHGSLPSSPDELEGGST